MKKVQLWSVRPDNNGDLVAHDVPSIENTKTEEQLEDILVRSPDALMEGLKLIGRQVPTEGGPLDLLGVDQDGRLVIFELKREKLTRDAVAQILDYTSYLNKMDTDRFARLIEDSSGQKSIDKIEDFTDWYVQKFPDRENIFDDSPKMILVGLGVDSRALRMVDFLAEPGIDISLLTFNAFEQDGTLFLARQVESVSPKSAAVERRKSYDRDANLQALRANALQYGVTDFIEEVIGFIKQKTPERFLQRPGKWGYTFHLSEYTNEGRPTWRAYVNVSIEKKRKGFLHLYFYEQSRIVIGDAMSSLTKILGQGSITKDKTLGLKLSKNEWEEVKSPLKKILEKIVQGRKSKDLDQSSADD